MNKRIPELPFIVTPANDDLFAMYDQSGDITGFVRLDQVSQGSESVNLQWDTNLIYNTGDIVTEGGKIYESTQDNNQGNLPGTGPEWTEISKSPAVGYWVAGVYTESFVLVVYQNNAYLLDAAAGRPYNSTVSPDLDSNFIRINREVAIEATYATIAAMTGDQANQIQGQVFEVTDASADATVDSGKAWYKLGAVQTASLTDYTKLSEEEAFTENVLAQVLLRTNNLSDLDNVATARSNLSVYSQAEINDRIQKQAAFYAVASGAANAYVVTLTPAPSAYVDGLRVKFRTASANTGASTINVNALGIKSVVRRDGTALQADDIPAGSFNEVIYESANDRFQLMNSGGGGGAAATIENEKYQVGPDLDNVFFAKYTTPIQLTAKLYNGVTSLTYRRKLDDGIDTYTSETSLTTLNTWLAGLSDGVDVDIEVTSNATILTYIKFTVDRT